MEYFFLLLFTSLAATSKMSSAEPELIIIDTDGGGDDAAAMLLALSNNSKAKILAITCCFGNTNLENACSNVLRILTLCKNDKIPVYRGSGEPLIERDVHRDRVFGADGFGNVAHEFSTGDLKVSETPAAIALSHLSKKYPGKINLIAIAPLTNVALAQKVDPGFTERLKSLVIMGGNYSSDGSRREEPEFNFSNDPESAHIILSEARCPTTMVPFQITVEFGMTWDFFDKLTSLQTPKAQFVKKINGYYRTHSKGKRYYDCDFQAMAAFLHPESVTDRVNKTLTVELDGSSSNRGLVIPVKQDQRTGANKTPNHQIKIITGFNREVLNKLRYDMVI